MNDPKYDSVKIAFLVVIILFLGVFIFSKWQDNRETANVYGKNRGNGCSAFQQFLGKCNKGNNNGNGGGSTGSTSTGGSSGSTSTTGSTSTSGTGTGSTSTNGNTNPTAPETSSAPKGLYVSLLGYDYALPQSYQGSTVDGFDIYLNWSQLEPSYNTYNWTTLDNDIAIAQAANKPYIIGVQAGNEAPAWIFQSGAYGSGVTYVPVSETRASGSSLSYNSPVPWNSTYLTLFDQLITQLSTHLSTESYQNLIGVQITGINDSTMETRLPGQNTSNPAATATLWQKAGYTPSKVLSTWQTIASYWEQAFPNTHYMITLIRPWAGFPLTDANGNPTTSEVSGLDISHNIAQQAAFMFSSKATIMGTYLNGDGGNYGIEDAVTTAIQGGALGGYQLEENIYDSYSKSFAQPADSQSAFQTALQQGLASGATYFEIYPVDVQAFPAILPGIDSSIAAK